MKKGFFVFFIFISLLSYSQEKDTLLISKKDLQDLIRTEVQKELNIQKKEFKTQQSDSSPNLSFLKGKIIFSGKSTLRVGEWDFNQNSLNPTNGFKIKDHTRFWSRFNFHLMTDVALSPNFDFHARIRTGNKQYSFINFGGNSDERFNIILDELWLDWKFSKNQFRLGRQNASRIWTNQQGVLFDVPTHDGISFKSSYLLGSLTLNPKFALFIENYKGNTSFKEQGKIYGGAINIKQKKENISWTFETGLLIANELPTKYTKDWNNNGNNFYMDGDLAPDYTIWTNHWALTLPKLQYLTFAFDYFYNMKNYKRNPISSYIYDASGYNSFSNPKEFNSETAPNFTKQRNGFIGTVSLGNSSIPKNIFLGISYLYMEKYAAMDYFAQYDFVPWASTNIQGPEFTISYRLNKFLEFKSRLFFMEQIKGLYGIDPSYKKSSNRLRFDININF